jgi:GxxExxY protein
LPVPIAQPIFYRNDRPVCDFTAEYAEERGGLRVDENTVGEIILGCAIRVHTTLGPGLLESAYEACLAHELSKARLNNQRQVVLPVIYDGLRIDAGYRLDLLVDARVVVEVKAVERLAEIHRAQLLSYLKLGGFRLGYLLNFNVPRMKEGISRLVNGL